MRTSFSSISIVGYVSERDSASMSSASQRTLDLTPWQPSWTFTRPRYVVRPPPLLTDLLVMIDVVFGAAWIILEPASWCMPEFAYATESTSPRAPSPIRYTAGYFIVSFDPILPST